jgi:membrane protein DedA with SNARE-associated domain
LALLGAIWIASVGVPIPEDIALLGGGLACYLGKAEIAPMILMGMFAVLSGDLFIFYLGHRWASNLLEHRMSRKLATPERVAKLRVKFHEHQLKTIFLGRFLPGVRALVFLTAGAMKISVWRFLAMNGLAAAISVPVFVVLGYVFGHSYDKLKVRVEEIKYIIVFVLIGIAIMWVLWLTYSRSARVRETERLLKE